MDFLKFIISRLLKKSLNIPAIRNSTLDDTSRICAGSSFIMSSIGKYSYVGNYCNVIKTKIGRYCSIADNCTIGGASHPIEWASTSPVFHKGRNVLHKNFSNHEYEAYKETLIGNDVWIGSMCLLKAGIHIGDGAVIGMGSVVTKDVEAYSIVAGNPAKKIRMRFDESTISKLLELEWWDLQDAELVRHAEYIHDINSFIDSF